MPAADLQIRCDLANVAGAQPCTHCAQARASCQIRPSKRGSGKRLPRLGRIGRPLSEGHAHLHGSPHAVRPVEDCQDPPTNGLDGLGALQGIVRGHPPACTNTVAIAMQTPPSLASNSIPRSSTSYTPLPSPASLQAYSTPASERSGSSLQPSVQTSFGNSGYMQMFSRDNVVDEDKARCDQFAVHLVQLEVISPALQEGFIESYLEYCYAWCPVLDAAYLHGYSVADGSPLLKHALALCGTCTNPPLIQASVSSVYYKAAKSLFYNNSEDNALVRLASIMLFFWWSTGAPNLVNMDNAWWWTGIAIRIAQECGLHREPQGYELSQSWDTAGLRRRIWWTLFARDRILSISQGRPAIIDQDYCNVSMVTVEDFPDPSDLKAQIFVHWVQLMGIGGRISKHLSRNTEDPAEIAVFSQDLAVWLQNLPESLSLSICTARTTAFNRDLHRLYVTYLTYIILLHLSKSSHSLPQASNVAIIAASATARLFEDILTRGKIRFLSGDAGWELAVALLPLLHARRFEDLRPHADADIYTLRTALRQMALLWPSSRMFNSAFDKLSAMDEPAMSQTESGGGNVVVDPRGDIRVIETVDTVDSMLVSMDLFPFVTDQTSPLISAVFARDTTMPFEGLDWPLDISASLQEFLPLYNDEALDSSTI